MWPLFSFLTKIFKKLGLDNHYWLFVLISLSTKSITDLRWGKWKWKHRFMLILLHRERWNVVSWFTIPTFSIKFANNWENYPKDKGNKFNLSNNNILGGRLENLFDLHILNVKQYIMFTWQELNRREII